MRCNLFEQFVNDEISLQEFYESFMEDTCRDEGYPQEFDYVSHIKLYLCEYTSGHRTPEELKELVRNAYNYGIYKLMESGIY